ncbi:MAG: hypothetical protein COA42_09290 [Alteromonadaceae bacterium]|nr:MAG: hypothetical protein COA42_09290 [Alteromonadaceae bacterium]
MNARYPSILVFVFSLVVSNLSFAGSIWSADYQGEKWHDNFSAAKKTAAAQSKPVLVYFSGSDWCRSCAELDQNTLVMDGFQKLAKQSLVLMNADFPSESAQSANIGQQNDRLREQYGVLGFPTMVLVNPSTGEKITKFSGCSFFSCKEDRVLKKLAKALKKFSDS